MQINIKWHTTHPMPENADMEQRIAWHIAHQKNCNCRDMPAKIKAEIKKRKIKS